ncbi:hypothetical protein ACQ4PT_052475 [Festuca glaucescens]
MGDALPPPAEWRDWAALHSNALCAILSKIPQADILRGAGAGLACKLWRRIAVEEDLLWRRIELAAAEDTDPDGPAGWQVMARAAVDRSAGRCESYRGRADAEFLMYDVSRRQGDRFIPCRASEEDRDIARYLLTEKENAATVPSPSKGAYRELLAEKMLSNRTRIFSFRNKLLPEPNNLLADHAASIHANLAKKHRLIPLTPDRILDAPDLADDYRVNLLDWGRRNMLSIALGNRICLLDESSGSISELATVHEDDGPVTSVSWAPDGRHIAVGLASSVVQLWDSTSSQLLRTLEGVHESGVGSLAWRDNKVLTSGDIYGKIVNNDMMVAQ